MQMSSISMAAAITGISGVQGSNKHCLNLNHGLASTVVQQNIGI
jgi:hypothetical protein